MLDSRPRPAPTAPRLVAIVAGRRPVLRPPAGPPPRRHEPAAGAVHGRARPRPQPASEIRRGQPAPRPNGDGGLGSATGSLPRRTAFTDLNVPLPQVDVSGVREPRAGYPRGASCGHAAGRDR